VINVGHRDPFFKGSEFPRLVVLAGVMLVGWGLVWNFAGRMAPALGDIEPESTVQGTPKPIRPDPSPAFDSVNDRTPIGFRDTAAYGLLLERARSKTPLQLAGEARRDLLLAHLWERPEQYRGAPIHLLGTARRILYYESKLSKTGWLYEAWIFPNDERTVPYVCVFEDAPKGLPIGPAVSERVVFNGYFLKIMRYQAGDVVRGAPVLVGRIGWEPSPTPTIPAIGPDRTLFWSLVVLGVLFVLSLLRWGFQLSRLISGRSQTGRVGEEASRFPEFDPDRIQNWLESLPEESDPEENR
jgi:hypothetical protein